MNNQEENTLKTNKTQEQLYNRIFINFGIGILAYFALYCLYYKFYMKNTVTFALAGIFTAAAIVCYALSKKKPLKNYAHMFVAFTVALLFTRLAYIITMIFGISAFEKMQEVYFLKKLLQTRWEVIIIAWMGAAYLLGMLIYNGILMNKVGKEERALKRKKNK